jgi:hypothetical protein
VVDDVVLVDLVELDGVLAIVVDVVVVVGRVVVVEVVDVVVVDEDAVLVIVVVAPVVVVEVVNVVVVGGRVVVVEVADIVVVDEDAVVVVVGDCVVEVVGGAVAGDADRASVARLGGWQVGQTAGLWIVCSRSTTKATQPTWLLVATTRPEPFRRSLAPVPAELRVST